jgi:hypothetical protein
MQPVTKCGDGGTNECQVFTITDTAAMSDNRWEQQEYCDQGHLVEIVVEPELLQIYFEKKKWIAFFKNHRLPML